MSLANKVSLITGIDTEIGTAIGVLFAREGASVVGCHRSFEKGQKALRSIEGIGGNVILVQGDVTQATDAENIVKISVKEFGRLDILVNYGAARRILGTIMDISEEDFNEEMAADLKAVISLSRCAIAAMAQGGGGAIVNISSIVSLGVKGRALRSASKAALSSLTRAMALDHGHQNIRVNAVLIGPTLTSDMLQKTDQLKLLEQQAPVKRLHTPEDVAAAVLFLASDEAKAITGVLLPVDAGRSLPTF